MRAPRKARSDRDSSKWDLPGRTSEAFATGSKPSETYPSACQGGRNSPSGSRRWPASSSCSRIPGPDPTPSESLTSHCSLSKTTAEFLSPHFQIRFFAFPHHGPTLLLFRSRVLSSFCGPFSTPATTFACTSSIQSQDFVTFLPALHDLDL